MTGMTQMTLSSTPFPPSENKREVETFQSFESFKAFKPLNPKKQGFQLFNKGSSWYGKCYNCEFRGECRALGDMKVGYCIKHWPEVYTKWEMNS